MKFPAYVPVVVQENITRLLDGNSRKRGLSECLDEAEKRLAAIEERMQNHKNDDMNSLRKQKAEAQTHRDQHEGDVDCLRRLACDHRMKDVYGRLAQEFTQDEQWWNFIWSAWAVRLDYSKFRDRLKQAQELKHKIADTADLLSKLIRQLDDTGIKGPIELCMIPDLLAQTDQRMQNLIVKSFEWGAVPDVSVLIKTIANVARSFEPEESSTIAAAIKSRQRSTAGNKEYLRAFGSLLTEFNIPLTANIMNAMAIVATAVINDSNLFVRYDDVAKAIGSL